MEEQILFFTAIALPFITYYFYITKWIDRKLDDELNPLEEQIKNPKKISKQDREKINFIEGYECNMRFHAELEPNACQQPQNLVDEYDRLTVWLNDNYSTYSDYKSDVGIKQYSVRFEKY